MSKASFHQNLIGKKLVEDPRYTDPEKYVNDRATFKFYGLVGKSVSIVGAWITEGSVKVMVADSDGHTAEVFMSVFLLKDEEKDAARSADDIPWR